MHKPKENPGTHRFDGSRAAPPLVALVDNQEPPVRKLREIERIEIGRAMAATSANVARAARLLGIGRATLYRKLAQFQGRSSITGDTHLHPADLGK